MLFELSAQGSCRASDLTDRLKLDPAYMSRLLRTLESRGFVKRTPSRRDRRAAEIALTGEGSALVQRLSAASEAQLRSFLEELSTTEQRSLQTSLQRLKTLLRLSGERLRPRVRGYREGELGVILQLHGELYKAEYGYNREFEAYVAEGLAKFARKNDPQRERLWVAEQDGEIVGAVAIVRYRPGIAQLRWFFVSPHARGHGLGTQLLRTALQFSKRAQYRKIMLWTTSDLLPARHLYEQEGFARVASQRHRAWGQLVTEERWERAVP